MTRLQVLLQALGDELTKEEKKEIILDYFDNQDLDKYDLGEIYYIYNDDDCRDKLEEYHSEKIYEAISLILDSEYYIYGNYIEERDILSGVMEKAEYFSIPGLQLLENIEGYYIFIEEQKTLFR